MMTKLWQQDWKQTPIKFGLIDDFIKKWRLFVKKRFIMPKLLRCFL